MNQLLSQKQQNHGFVKEEIQSGIAEGNYEYGVKVGKWVFTFPDRIEEGEFKGKYKVGNWTIKFHQEDLYHIGQYDEFNLKTGEWIICKNQHSESYLKQIYKRGKMISEKLIEQLQISTIQIKTD